MKVRGEGIQIDREKKESRAKQLQSRTHDGEEPRGSCAQSTDKAVLPGWQRSAAGEQKGLCPNVRPG